MTSFRNEVVKVAKLSDRKPYNPKNLTAARVRLASIVLGKNSNPTIIAKTVTPRRKITPSLFRDKNKEQCH